MKTLFIATLAALAFNVNAATITIGETTNPLLDSTFIDVGDSHFDTREGGLEWLDFGGLVEGSMTFGHSLTSAAAAYGVGNGGWRLATYTEIYSLFDLFFPTFVNESDGKMTLTDTLGTGNDPLIQSRNSWIFGFGTDAEVTAGGTITLDKSNVFSTGLYLDEYGEVSLLGLKIDTNPLLTTIYGPEFRVAGLTADSSFDNMGVFMVRDYVVPIPPAVWLFGSGLIGLVGIARRKAV